MEAQRATENLWEIALKRIASGITNENKNEQNVEYVCWFHKAS